MKLFLTDADYKHTLGAIRRLAARGVDVVAGATSWRAQGLYSRYCSQRVITPPPSSEIAFTVFLVDYMRQNPVDALLPIGYAASRTVSKYLPQFEEATRTAVASYDAMQIASEKDRTYQFAERCGVRIPRIYASAADVEQFPVVVKSTGESHRLHYVNDADALAHIGTTGAVIQEYIPGDGYGFYALYRHGGIRAYFMHRRIREYPATGGASTAAESVYDPEIREIGERLLNALQWHGVAMVELKKDSRDGRYTLMEINPKFWGSLDLAAASGVDFAWLTARMAIDGDIEPVSDYRLGVRYHWLYPDEILHIASRPSSIGAVLRDTLDAKVRGNVEWRDPLPTLFQIGMTGVKLLTRTLSGDLRRPHGEPRISR